MLFPQPLRFVYHFLLKAKGAECTSAPFSVFPATGLFKEKLDQLFVRLPVRLIAHGQIQKRRFIDNALIVAERFEARFAVVGAESARAEAAEGHIRRCKMDDYVVYAAAAEADLRGQAPDPRSIGREHIQRESLYVKIGRTGPKISSCMTASVYCTPSKTVGSIFRLSASVFPP